ncbi:OmpA family protein [Cytophaga hutchinsonii]|uniref:Outer membrane protein, OmpA family n=1 Tax=Cytophaga hutchinsonii (strain ATCC 33406 / DSM 1761 / CIP 103989 / NBRC 15051 / NCIMB 9469 / D465) TaxID=269798 RepID=A0A6N4SNB0_CYTH3|nr:OmpA family protein [Cytophaga hutchinsonii]ABG57771.1 outer membrane protein, OmpA family [Cytophaga hutchinsonii ATCC 33406]SFX05087.1 WD40-like Beta Propeller Repeat [Cytophaga hutchinsonii ATCC 33406]
MNRILFILLSFFLFICSVFGQDDKLIKKGDAAFQAKNYSDAFVNYELAWQQNKEHPYVNFMLAQCYLLTSPKQKALDYAGVAVRKSPNPTNEMYFVYAQALHQNHRWDSAIYYYKKSDPGKLNSKNISRLEGECMNGKRYTSNPKNIKITNAGALVNSQGMDYLPNITADLSKLYFTSRRGGSTGGKLEADGLPYEDIYMCSNVGGAWNQAINIGAPLNTDVHDACVGISEGGQTMFIYRGVNGGDIFQSELKGKKWSAASPLPMNTEFFETSACLSPDERTLFFVRATNAYSNRDIYMCSRTVGGNWSKPVKLTINTPFDEDAPYMHPDGKTLYFSSKGHSTMGGYDVFKTTKLANGVWSTPENMGSPVNTAGDDVYFVLSADGKIGYYSSNKEGGFGKQDIYSIRMPAAENEPELALLKGKILDDQTGKPTEASITITDNATKEIVARYRSNSETGEYLLSLPAGKNYGIAIEKEGHLFYSENMTLNNTNGFKEYKQDITLVTIKTSGKIILRNIFFDSGKATIRLESTAELLKLVDLLKNNPTLRIEIAGHTDNIGDETLNQKLSEERAKNVVTFLTANGISAGRLVAKGYGSSQPVAPNTTDTGRQQNRRTEIKIL